MPSGSSTDTTPAAAPPRALRTCAVLGLIAFVPSAALSIYACHHAASAVEQLVRSNSLAAALFTRELVHLEFQYGFNFLRELSRRPDLIAAVAAHDEAAVRARYTWGASRPCKDIPVGGVIGIVLGYAASALASMHPSMTEVKVPAWSVFLALGFSAGVGIFFGLMPAFKAAIIHPIDALRHE